MNITNNPREAPAAMAQLRAEIERLPRNKGGKRLGVPEDLKRRAATAFDRSGIQANEFAAAIAVSPSALFCWKSRYGSVAWKAKSAVKVKTGFKKVSVEPEPTPKAIAGITIEGPGGMRITGLDADAVARLWRALC